MKQLKPDFIKNSIISQFLDDIKESIKGSYNRGTYIKVDVNKGKTNNSDDAIVINVKTTDKSVKLNYDKTIKAIKDACEGYCTASKNEEADTYGQSKGVVKNKDLQLQLIDVKPTTKFIKFVEGDNYNMKDSYYTEAEKKDKKFVKSAIEEMSRYIRNWDYLTKKEKQNIGCSLNELRKRVDELKTVKLEDNFCCLVPGLPKLKRADKKFNQPSGLNYKVTDSRKLKDAEYVDYDDGEGPFKSFEELTKYASEYDLDTEVIYPDRITMKCCQWIISGDRENLSNFLTKYYNKDQLEYIHDAKFNDVEPRKNESKEDFIPRFMSETKSEYPDRKQRLAVAYSYWNRAKGIKDKKVKDWMPSKTPIDYIKEKLDAEGIEYEIEDDVYGETAPFDTWITVTKGDDSRADDIICSVVGSAYEWVRDKEGNRRYCKVVTDEELIDEFNN